MPMFRVASIRMFYWSLELSSRVRASASYHLHIELSVCVHLVAGSVFALLCLSSESLICLIAHHSFIYCIASMVAANISSIAISHCCSLIRWITLPLVRFDLSFIWALLVYSFIHSFIHWIAFIHLFLTLMVFIFLCGLSFSTGFLTSVIAPINYHFSHTHMVVIVIVIDCWYERKRPILLVYCCLSWYTPWVVN